MINPKEIITEAINVIDRDGWCQGQMEDERGRVCLMGALRKGALIASGETVPSDSIFGGNFKPLNEPHTQALRQVFSKIKKVYPPYSEDCGIAAFNDDSSTTLEDVQLILKRALEDE